jgi:hypothetical protein
MVHDQISKKIIRLFNMKKFVTNWNGLIIMFFPICCTNYTFYYYCNCNYKCDSMR